MFKVNNRNTRTKCEICLKLTIKIPEGYHWRRTGKDNNKDTIGVVLVSLLLTSNIFHTLF